MEPIYRTSPYGTLTQLETQGRAELFILPDGDGVRMVWARNLACAQWILADYLAGAR